MPQYTFAPVPVATVPLRGEYSRFPVHRIYCVGRNFAEHAKEMGAPVEKGTPVIFMKPGDAIVTDGRVPYPAQTDDLHHEVELVVALGRDAAHADLDGGPCHLQVFRMTGKFGQPLANAVAEVAPNTVFFAQRN